MAHFALPPATPMISDSLIETARLLTLLHCNNTYYMHCCLLHFTETNKW